MANIGLQLESGRSRLDYLFEQYAGVDVLSADAFLSEINDVYYKYWFDSYDDRHVQDILQAYRKLLGTLVLPLELDVLSVGGGTGFELSVAQDLAIPYRRFTLIDPSSEMIEVARKKYGHISGVEFLIGTLADVPARRSNARLVWLNSIMHHVVHYEQFFEQLRAVLAPGDFLILGHEPRNEYSDSTWFWCGAVAQAAFGGALLRRFGPKRNDPRWTATIDELVKRGVLRSAVPPLVVRRLVDYGVGIKRDINRLGVPPERDEGLWTLSDVARILPHRVSLEFYTTYRHFGDSGGRKAISFANTIAEAIFPRSGSQFLALLLVS